MKITIRTNEDKEYFLDYVKKHIKPDNIKRWYCECTFKRKAKTYDQIKLYWAWIECICLELGYLKTDKETVHIELKRKHLKPIEKEIFNKPVKVIPSLKDFDTKQMSDYMESIRLDMEINYYIILPLPEDRFIDSFMERYG